MHTRLFFLLGALSLLTISVSANDAIRQAVTRLKPAATDIEIKPTEIEGISEVTMGLQVLYVSDDGEYALAGPLISLDKGTNLTEERRSSARASLFRDADDVSMFRYPADKPKYKVTVFTDIDCPHCRRLHNELPAMQAAGIDVTYVLLPRSGVGSPSYKKSVNAACADDPEAAITAAMAGQQPSVATCDHPIDDQLKLSRSLNVSSTPSILLEDGQLVLGYHTADRLLKVIEQRLATEGSPAGR